MTQPLVLDLAEVRMNDVANVGGKSASLGEMISQLGAAGVRVPGGFATTASAYRDFLSADTLNERIARRLSGLDTNDVKALNAAGPGDTRLDRKSTVSAEARRCHPRSLRKSRRAIRSRHVVAVRSSATAEDLPDASLPASRKRF
jgi:pyruvate,water dikinase